MGIQLQKVQIGHQGPSDWTTNTRSSTSTSFEFQISDASRVLALHVGVKVEREAHGMRWVCVVIMWSLQTRIEKSFSYDLVLVLKSEGLYHSRLWGREND